MLGAEPPEEEVRTAGQLMLRFADRTGLTRQRSNTRYLWTDAFAVLNFLALAKRLGVPNHFALALRLIDDVHHVLGRHRGDDIRKGWISGLEERQAERHPTSGGLRIGKPLPERAPGVAVDERLEWDRDGQYFHYLTKWMHALDVVARSTQQAELNVWARELALVAWKRFVTGPQLADGRRMHWKMSIDLSRPLVASMGQHDPVDGFVTCMELSQTASRLPTRNGPELCEEVAGFAAMIEVQRLATTDPLGIGGLLTDAARLAQLMSAETCGDLDAERLLDAMLVAAEQGLSLYCAGHELDDPASHRLAFRELGLAIGLAGLALLRASPAARRPEASRLVEELAAHAPVAEEESVVLAR